MPVSITHKVTSLGVIVFFYLRNMKLLWYHVLTLGFVVLISNPEIKNGCIPQLRICKGVYAGDSLVTCINDNIRIINTFDHEIEVIIPTLKLEEVTHIPNQPTPSELENALPLKTNFSKDKGFNQNLPDI